MPQPKISEIRLQQEIIRFFNNTYPDLRGLLCYNNNNSDGGYRGHINKFLGIVPGRSDLVLYFEGGCYMIELKVGKGNQSKVQKEWEKLIKSQGFEYVVIRSLDEFQNYIKEKISKFANE